MMMMMMPWELLWDERSTLDELHVVFVGGGG